MPNADEIMTKEVITFSPDDTLLKIITYFTENKISGAPVLDKEKIVGMISGQDIIRFVERKKLGNDFFSYLPLINKPKRGLHKLSEILEIFRRTKVKEIMSKKVITAKPEMEMNKVAAVMHKNKVNHIPIIDKKCKILGIISRQDIIKAF